MSDASIQQVRIRWIVVMVVVAAFLVILRLFSLQLLHSSDYRERAEHQYVTPNGQIFDRGNIYFTSKDTTTVAAATVSSGFKVTIMPSQIEDAAETYAALSRIIPLDKDVFFAKVEKKADPYEEIAERIDDTSASAITALRLSGVTLYREKWRFYPGGPLASQAIGFVSYKDDDLVGNYGLEEYYNDVLSRNANNLYVNFFAEIFANMQSTIFKNRAATGDIVTSIEPAVQSELEHQVSVIEEKWSSEQVGGIVLDPATGEIIAMAHAPSFDLNEYGSVKDASRYANPSTQNVYEMGSIIKPLVMAAAIDAGAVTPATTYYDGGSVTINNKLINNFDKRGRGKVTMQDVLNQSLNTGMVFVQQYLGKDAFRDYMLERYKIGERTGIDAPGEGKGLVSSLKGTNDVNFATAAFGQGIATTPISIVRSFAALANGGTLVTPHLATAIQKESGGITPLEYKTAPTGLKPETISTIKNMLVKVVDDGYHRGLEHYSVAAKTGTAQIARPGGGGYYEDRNLHSLIGFFPAEHPRFVVYLYNVYPKGANYAIATLGDPFFNMVQFLANYYEISPDR